MTHAELSTFVFALHAGLVAAALVAFYKLGDRSEQIITNLQRINQLLKSLRRVISEQLIDKLAPVFDNIDAVVKFSELIDLRGEPIRQEIVNPAGGEEYRNALSDFIDAESDTISDYRSLKSIQKRWRGAMSLRSWTIHFFLLWQITITSLIALTEQLIKIEIANPLLYVSLTPTAFMILLFFSLSLWITSQNDRIIKYVVQYDAI